MRIALDATPLAAAPGGIARYTSELSLALARQFPQDQYLLLSDQRFPMPEQAPANLRPGRSPGSFPARRWWLCGLTIEMLRERVDVFHGVDFAVPYLPLRPSVVTVHDLAPWKREDWNTSSPRVRRRAPYLLRLGLATMIVTPTARVRRELIDAFGVHSQRVAVVPLAAGDHFRPVEGPQPARPYFLYVGALEPRKNLSLLVEAWRAVRRRHQVDLVLAGRARDDFRLPDAEPGLRITGEVAEAELPLLYSRAVACVYPSFYEGFGLPVLEAMQSGALVIASDDESLVEVTAGAAIHRSAASATAWVEAMTLALEQPGRVAAYRESALRRAREFTWQRTAQLTRDVYEEAQRRFRS